MTIPDLINGTFESFGGVMSWVNIFYIRKPRQVRGVSSFGTWIWCVWGLWNLYYYPHLGQWMSFIGGLVIVSGNCAWCYYAWRYRNG